MLRSRQSMRHTHDADRQMTDAATEGRVSDLLLRPYLHKFIITYPSQAETHICWKWPEGPGSHRSFHHCLRETFSVLTNHKVSQDDWSLDVFLSGLEARTWSLCPDWQAWLSPVSLSVSRTPEFVLTKQFWHDSRQWAVLQSVPWPHSPGLRICIWNSH